MKKVQLVKIIEDRIQNMATKGVYYPRRLKPKWESLNDINEKLLLFEKYLIAEGSSIGFKRLMKVNLPEKTLESVILENPDSCNLLSSKGIYDNCLSKFKKYKNGQKYLLDKGIEQSIVF